MLLSSLADAGLQVNLNTEEFVDEHWRVYVQEQRRAFTSRTPNPSAEQPSSICAAMICVSTVSVLAVGSFPMNCNMAAREES